MSHDLNRLPVNTLSGIVRGMESLSARARTRIREEMQRLKLSQRDLAGILKWPQSKVAHLLTGRVGMLVDDLDGFSFALNLSATEIVRDRGMEFCAEMTPSELRIHERLRALPPERLAALMSLLDIKLVEPKRALPQKQPQRHGR